MGHGIQHLVAQLDLAGPGRHTMAWEEVLKDMIDLMMCDLPVMITNHL